MTLPDNETLAKLLADATPGPWTTFNATDVFPDDDDDSGGNHIADCDMGSNFNTHEIISNARLIALAPTLAAEVIALRATLAADSIITDDAVAQLGAAMIENAELRKRVEAADAMADALEWFLENENGYSDSASEISLAAYRATVTT